MSRKVSSEQTNKKHLMTLKPVLAGVPVKTSTRIDGRWGRIQSRDDEESGGKNSKDQMDSASEGRAKPLGIAQKKGSVEVGVGKKREGQRHCASGKFRSFEKGGRVS